MLRVRRNYKGLEANCILYRYYNARGACSCVYFRFQPRPMNTVPWLSLSLLPSLSSTSLYSQLPLLFIFWALPFISKPHYISGQHCTESPPGMILPYILTEAVTKRSTRHIYQFTMHRLSTIRTNKSPFLRPIVILLYDAS